MQRRGVVTIEAKIEDIISFVGEKIFRRNFIGLNVLSYYFWYKFPIVLRNDFHGIKKVSFHVSMDEDNERLL